jgi:hypothetical protein
VTTGEREIEPAEAAIVERIFREFVSGVATRGTGILNNELYVGRLIWNRLRYVKNPDNGKRISRLNPQADWITQEIPRSEATEALRGLVDAIVLTPDQAHDAFQIELRGNLAAMLTVAPRNEKVARNGRPFVSNHLWLACQP